MQTYQRRQTKQQMPAAVRTPVNSPAAVSNQLALKSMGADNEKASSQGLQDALRARFESSGPAEKKAFDTLQNVNAEQGRSMDLDGGLRGRLEAMTGYDLSSIKVRESRQAADMGAKAFAKGNVIHFAPGQYRPESKSGQHMIAHEVAHVVQQARGGIKADSHALNVNTDTTLESSADRMGSQLLSGDGSYSPAQSLMPLPSMDVSAAPVQGLFGGFGKKIKGFASSVGSAIASGAKSAWKGTKNFVSTASTKISNVVGSAIDNTGIGLSYLGGKIADGASYLGGKVASGAKSAWRGTKDFASSAADKIGAGAGYVADKVGSGLGWAGGKIADGASFVGGKVASGAEKAWNGAGRFASAAATRMGEVSDSIGLTAAGKKLAKGASYVGGKIADGVSYAADKTGLSYAGKKIADGASYLGGKIATGAKSAWAGVKKFGSWLGKGASYVADKAGKGLSYAGSKIAKGASYVGGKIASGARSAWEGAKDFAEDIRESHHKAVDEFNNNRDEYSKLSFTKRLKWMASNPLARLFAASEKDGTKKRNVHELELEKAANELAASRGAQESGTLTDDEIDYAEGGNARGTNHARQEDIEDIADKTSKAGYVSSGIGMGVSKLSESTDMFSSLGGAGGIAEGVGSGLGVASSGFSAIKTGMGAYDKFKDGDYAGAAAGALDTIRGGAETGRKAALFAQALAPAIEGTVGNVVPGLSIAMGGAQAASGAIRMASANSTRKAMNKRLEKFAPKDGDKTDRSKIFDADMSREEKLLRMAQSNSKIKMTEAGFDMGSGALKAAGGALSFAPVPGLGQAVGILGSVGDVAKSLVSSKMKSTHKTDTLNREFNLDGEIEDYVKTHQGTSKRDAQRIVLKSRGFKSGSKEEAFTNTAARNAIWLHQQASKEGPEGENARGILKDMGLRNTGNKLSIQGIAEKLGIEEGTDWRKQIKRSGKTTPSWRDD